MSQEVQGMLIQLEATTAQLRREMATADAVVGRTTKSMDGKLAKVDGAFDRMNVTADKAVSGAVSSLRGLVAPIAAAASAMAALGKAVDVQREFDRLNAGLITATGSSEKATVAFQALREFAQKTPYDLAQAVEGFTKLVNLGLTPSEKALMSYGNTASSMGKDLNQMIEAVADAATGEFERLKEFGIKAAKQGDQVSLTFQGVTTKIGNNAAEIEQYLVSLGENQFAGAMQLRMQSLDGAIANLGDTWDQTFRLINDAGAGELMRGSVVMVVEALEELNAMLESGQLEAHLDAIGGKFDGWGADIESTLDTLGEVFTSLFEQMGSDAESKLAMLTDGFSNFPENVRAFVQLMTVEVLAGFDKAVAYAESFKGKVKAVFTDDTFVDVNTRLAADLARINSQRDDSISSIIGERDAAVGSYNQQITAADALRKKYDEKRAASKGNTTDRLAQFKIEKEGQEAVAGSTDKATAATKKQLATIDALIAKYDPAAKAQKTYADGMALADAQYKANKISAEQYQKVVQGLWAELNKPIWDKHNKEADEAAKRIKAVDDAVQGVLDRLDPAATAARKYAADQKSINDAMREHPERIEEYRGALEKLGAEYGENSKATNEWTKWTEDSLERVDSAFADAWRNIGDGFSGFRDSLTNAFKQMLAELAHMAITKPIIMQIGASLGIGGGSSGGGLLSSVMGGGSGGGMDFGKILNYGQSIYSGLTGVGPAVLAGYQSGGIGGALSGGAGYYGNLAGNAASTVGGWFGMGGGAAASSAAGSTAAGYTGSAYSAWAAGQGGAGAGAGLSGLGALAGPAAAAFAALQAYKAYGDGVRLDAKDTRGNAAAWATGYQPLAEISGAVSKLTEALGIGGALGNILNIPSTLTAMVGSALFGGGWETKNAGLAFGVAGGDLKAQSYEDQKKKGGLFSSSKKRTRYKNLDAETDLAFQDMFQSTEDSVAEMFEALGLSVEESSLDGLKVARKKISTKGKTDEQIQTAIGEWFGTVSEAMNTELNKVFNTGLGLDLAGMQAFVGNLSGVNAALDAINLAAFESSVAGGKLAVKLTEAAGGLEALAVSTNTYYGAFFSEAEKVEDMIAAVQKAFSDSDVVLAGSRESYRKMVEGIDLTSAAGQQMFASLMGLAGQADTYYGILETRAAQAAQEAAQLAALQAQAAALYYDQFTSPAKKASDAVASVVAQFEALELALPGTRGGFMAAVDALDKTSESGLKMFNTLMGVAGAADAYYDDLEARAAQAVTGAYSLLERSVAAEKSALAAAYSQEKAEQDALLQSRRESQAQAASARATAYTDMAQTASAMSSALSGLSSALSAAIGQLVDDSSSAVEQRRSVAVAQLQRALSSGDLSNADSLAEAAKVAASVDSGLYGSFDDLRREQGRTANMLLELGDISASRQTAAEAQSEALQRMAEQATNDAQSFRQSIGSVKTSVDMAYEAEIAALDEQLALGKSQIDALNGIDNSVVSVADAVSALTAAISAALSIIPGMSGISVPGFAAGGLHTGGLRPVGEHGPELEVTGPARIYNASNTASMLGGGETASEVRGLRQEVGDLRAYLYQIAKNTGNTATGIRQQNEIGLPEAV